MNRDATENLRLDRRLLHRRGWISKAEREKALAALPDVSDKIAPSEEEAASGESPASSPPQPGPMEAPDSPIPD